MPDGGGIRTLKSRINHLVEKTVEDNIDSWFGITPASKGLRRVTLLHALGDAWSWFREYHSDLPHKIA